MIKSCSTAQQSLTSLTGSIANIVLLVVVVIIDVEYSVVLDTKSLAGASSIFIFYCLWASQVATRD